MNSAFERIASGRDGCLVQAALEFAADAYPELDVSLYLEQMRILDEAFDVYVGRAESATAILHSLNRFFYEELGFTGNRDEYYDPRNSYLNEVLDRRTGIPISLGVVYRALAAGAGIRLDGVNFPGHFLLSYASPSGHRLYIDVFEDGRWLEWSDCLAKVRKLASSAVIEEDDCLVASDRQILARMLRNLKLIYSKSELAKCLPVQKRLVELFPVSPGELRDLGVLYYHLDKPMMAMKTLEKLVRNSPEYAEQASVRRYLSEATKEAVRLN